MTDSGAVHRGVRHPFSAPHSDADKTPWESMADQEYTIWLPPNAPLEQRMYPGWGPYAQGYGFKHASDAVDMHAQGTHSELQPYQPDIAAPVPYYTIGVRPLENNTFAKYYGENVPFRKQHIEHMHFNGNEGSNFGMMKEGGVVVTLP